MASSGAMADFARMPTSRKILIFVVIGAVLFLLYYQLAYKSLKESEKNAQQNHKQATDQNATLSGDLDRFKMLRGEKDKTDEQIKQHQKALPTEAEVPAFFETLERKITEAGVEVLKWNKRTEEPVESFVKVPLEVELTGTFLQIKRFFASLVEKKVKPQPGDNTVQERERIVSIEDLSLTSPTIRNREIILTAKFTAVTFRQADVVVTPSAPGAPASNAPAPSPAGGPAPAMPSSPTAPPLPSAGTPAGAKARTEDALKKDEQRRDGAIEKANGDGSARLKGGL